MAKKTKNNQSSGETYDFQSYKTAREHSQTENTSDFAGLGSFSEEDLTRLRDVMATIAEQSRALLQELSALSPREPELIPAQPLFNPWLVADAFHKAAQKLMDNPDVVLEQRHTWLMNYLNLVQSLGLDPKLVKKWQEHTDAAKDQRFQHPAWQEHPMFRMIKDSYLLNSAHFVKAAESIQGLDPKTAHKVKFYTQQIVDALAPNNFAHMNPEVIQKTFETKGENLLKGFANYLGDLRRGKGMLDIQKTNLDHFRIGENIAATPGKVVYENELMQLIQYEPATVMVHARPLLIIPPWINKYYVFDLSAQNSFVRWAVAQGVTVFIISWVNPGRAQAERTFDDYMTLGPLAALTYIRDHCAPNNREGQTANVIGYCLGGVLLTCTLAYLARQGQTMIESATFFATLIDFADAGDLTVFIDEDQVRHLEKRMQALGYLDGRTMAESFNLLRANSLIWSNYINNYLLSREHAPHDMLFWNADATRLPASSHSFYLRNMYLANNLTAPDSFALNGVPIDIRRIQTPSFFISAKRDHIAPWHCAYAATQYFDGPLTFCLGDSGHVAGIFNPPAAEKYGFWTNPDHPQDHAQWLANATYQQGSWWPYWLAWLKKHAGTMRSASPIPAQTIIEDAPGRFVFDT